MILFLSKSRIRCTMAFKCTNRAALNHHTPGIFVSSSTWSSVILAESQNSFFGSCPDQHCQFWFFPTLLHLVLLSRDYLVSDRKPVFLSSRAKSRDRKLSSLNNASTPLSVTADVFGQTSINLNHQFATLIKGLCFESI